MSSAGSAMARRKSRKKATVPSSGRRLVVQASDPWIAWVEEGADYCRTDVSKLVDVALVFYLKAQGFTEPAPRRVP
jgi:hypothetical protein